MLDLDEVGQKKKKEVVTKKGEEVVFDVDVGRTEDKGGKALFYNSGGAVQPRNNCDRSEGLGNSCE